MVGRMDALTLPQPYAQNSVEDQQQEHASQGHSPALVHNQVQRTKLPPMQDSRGKGREDGQVRHCDVALGPRKEGEDQGEKYQYKKLATITVGVQRIAVILPVEEQEGEEGGRSQLQEEPRSEEDSQGQEDESQRGRTTQSNNEPVQERSSPERGEATLRREQPRRNCRK